jgi:rare lipoprotein A
LRILAIFFFALISITELAAQAQEGRGTWYETSSKSLSASHANLPFGTRVRITNLQNNKQVIVTINNRIDQNPDRLIDVSKAAAENIGMNPQNDTPVRIEVISRRVVSGAEAPGAETLPEVKEAPVSGAVAETPKEEPKREESVVTAAAQPPVAPQPPAQGGQGPAAPVPEIPSTSAFPSIPSFPSTPPTPAGMINQSIITINGAPGAQGGTDPKLPPGDTAPAGSNVPVTTPAPVRVPASPAGSNAPADPAPVRAPASPAAVSVSGSLYRIQVGSFLDEGNAAVAFNRLQTAGFSPLYERYGNYHRVVLTGIGAADIEGAARRLRAAGFQDILIKEER